MCDVGGGEVVAVHLLLQALDGGVDEEGRVGRAGTAPDDVWRGVVVPFGGFGEETGGFGGVGEVGADVVEAL